MNRCEAFLEQLTTIITVLAVTTGFVVELAIVGVLLICLSPLVFLLVLVDEWRSNET